MLRNLEFILRSRESSEECAKEERHIRICSLKITEKELEGDKLEVGRSV